MGEPSTANSHEGRVLGPETKLYLELKDLEFFKRWFGPLVITVLVAFIVVGVMAATLWGLHAQKVDRQYFAVDAQNRITPLVPLDQPLVSESQILAFAQECAMGAYSFDFANYKQQLQALQMQCFDQQGFEQFVSAMERAKVVETVRQQQLVATGTTNGAAVITNTGKLANGTFAWKVEVPMQVSYQRQGFITQQRLVVELTVIRVPTDVRAKGIAIAQYVSMEAS